MRHDVWKSGLVWAGLTAAVSGAIASGGVGGLYPQPTTSAPGHDPSACGDSRAHPPARGPALPYELDDDTIRFTPPVAQSGG